MGKSNQQLVFGKCSARIDKTTGERVAVLRTSDRLSFKSCRRKWAWNSHLRDNMQAITTADPLWLGSGMHYALEDFHGDKVYGTAANALVAYSKAYAKTYPKKLPPDWRDLEVLGREMMEYYEMWLQGRDPLPTYIHNGIPQVEANIKVSIDWDLIKHYCKGDTAKYDRIRSEYDRVEYSMQLDRVIQDENGLLWIMEYKSAKIMQTTHYLTDPQVSAYCWGADAVYAIPVAGVIYQQHKKDLPNGGRILKNGTVSTAQNQATTHRMYRNTLIEVYGDVSKAPPENIKYLNQLALEENADNDGYIRRDRVYRNAKTSQAESEKILMEAVDMLDPGLPLYPNPTRDCVHRCNFLDACVSMDDGSDWKHQLMLEAEERPEGYDGWRKNLPDPAIFKTDTTITEQPITQTIQE